MKNIIILICIINFFACKAQHPIVSLHNSPVDYGEDGYYFKDINNDLNPFEGTWVYSNGDTFFTLILQKKSLSHVSSNLSNYYTDALIGEYKYVENGIEKINTLQNLTINYSNHFKYNIDFTIISKFGQLGCVDCQPGNIYLRGSYGEPDCDRWMSPVLTARYFIENGVEKIDLHFSAGERIMTDMYGNPPPCDEYALPFGEYILIKQD